MYIREGSGKDRENNKCAVRVSWGRVTFIWHSRVLKRGYENTKMKVLRWIYFRTFT